MDRNYLCLPPQIYGRSGVSRWLFLGFVLGIGGCSSTSVAQAAPAETWSDFMPAQAIGARQFVEKNPERDGRGVVVAVLDTGVDPRASGLAKTSDGKTKVIEARDFSGQGDVEMSAASVVNNGKRRRVELGSVGVLGYETLTDAIDQKPYLGQFSEKQIARRLQDLNHNKASDDKLAVLVYRTGPGIDDVKAVIDLDGNGDLAGETPVSPYHVKQELIVPLSRDPKKDIAKISLAFEWDSHKEIAHFHFTDGSHGTHVAGIIAGYKVFDKKEWDGIAPGAQILSLKIGHNALAGGATTNRSFKRALQFAGEYSTRHKVPVVANASYGIGSAIEGQSDIDQYCNKLVQDHPLLTLSFSAGNAGPGLSSVGTPAAADLALAVGAMLPQAVVATTYGGKTTRDHMFAFSSRGGELTKPEVSAPGVASTSVPIWDGRDVKNGTSMAAPQVSGAMALIWSTLSDSKNAHSGIVRRALTYSAKPLEGYRLQDQGHGVVQVGPATKLAKRLLKNEEAMAALGYQVRAHAPNVDGQAMPGAYWRTGLYRPSDEVQTRIDVTPLLPKTTDAETRTRFRPVIELETDQSWVEISKPRLLFRGERTESFSVSYRSNKLKKPGVYTARVIGREKSANNDEVAFESWQTIIVPEVIRAEDNYEKSWKKVTVEPGEVWSKFVFVPPGATYAEVSVNTHEDKFASTYMAVFDPEGHRVRPRHRITSSERKTNAVWQADSSQLTAGTWELTFSGSIRSSQPSTVDVSVRFSGAKFKTVKKLKQKGVEPPSASASITNTFPEPFVGSASAQISGFVKRYHKKTKEQRLKIPVKVDGKVGSVDVKLKISKKLYNETTDTAVTVRDAKGKVVALDAFGSPTTSVHWNHGGGEASYTIEIEPGFTHPKREEWKVDLVQTLYLKEAVTMKIKAKSPIMAYPHTPLRLKLKADKTLPAIGKGYKYQGRVRLVENKGSGTWAIIPIEAEL